MADDRGLGMPADANPWLADQWNITKQGEFARRYGVAAARARAAEAGVTLGATKPAETEPKPKRIESVRIVNKFLGGDGRGYDGDGPPEE